MEVGDKVEVKLSRDWVMILEQKYGKYICRTKDYRIIEFSEFELQEIK